MRFFILSLLSLITYSTIFSQVAPDTYWIRFTDKNGSPYSINNPEAFLSPRAIDRRTAQGIAIQQNDIPVNQTYIDAVAGAGATVLNVSKWMNSVTVYTTNPSVITTIEGFSFVLSASKVSDGTKKTTSIKPFFDHEKIDKEGINKIQTPGKSGQSFSYGSAYNQINMLNGIALHDMGFDGTGMVIAVLDAGFTNANILSAFDSLWINGQILGTKDFVSPLSPNIFGSHSHGTNVLSTMGANLPGQMVGTAPHADYWLLRSENGSTEYLVEELNWVSAAEFADSVGADVINSSLGYTTFDDPSQDHSYSDMDGNTTPITIGADLAASKGILVVNSAGNSGNSSWLYIGAPADGDSVFTIGAVNSSGNYASFSSRGPTFDGRIKPDVVAQGQSTVLINAFTGSVTTGSGTSFSSPVTAGMVACLWSAFPDRKNTEVMEAIRQSASQYSSPDGYLGYGIPDYLEAFNILEATAAHTIQLDLKLYLEGAFDGAMMSTSINGLLPFNQPFISAPFNYSGNEAVTAIPSVDIVDWILIELRDTTEAGLAIASTQVARQACFLKSDGTIVDTSGTEMPSFTLTVSDSLFLVIHHRNHLKIMSSIALKDDGNGIYSFDFSNNINKAFGIDPMKILAPGIYGVVSGDVNADGSINEADLDSGWDNFSGNRGYQSGDLNLDGQVDNRDKDDFWYTNQSYSSQVPE
ncbi:MAG TPA: S8 family serine peptidase [Bacteroidales bacterium]|nr:S8 family serine peptidase [Bacteroidales bacterium]HRX97962.1 S8 family serine peptidase [Bacteroidales bacterium]